MKALAILLPFLLFGFALAITDPRCTDNTGFFSYPVDCSKFVQCTGVGQSEIQNCPPGEFFNAATNLCDERVSSGCVPLTCPPGVVEYYSYPDDCERYIECYKGEAQIWECSPGLYFNVNQKSCTAPSESNCGIYAVTTEPSYTTPAHAACLGVLPGAIVLSPVDDNCAEYIQCIGSVDTEMVCPTGLYFDFDRQMCDHPDLVTCSSHTPDPSTPVPPAVEIIEDPRCADGVHGYFPYPECTMYVECFGGLGYLMTCPSGLYFSEDKPICEDPALSSCGRVTVPPDPLSTIPPDADPDCHPTYYNYLFPYPGDCTKFMECIDAQKVVQDCPSGLHFNPTLMVCDYPYEAGCIW